MMIMDIDSKPGTVVVYNGNIGTWAVDSGGNYKLLMLGKPYTVESTEIHGWHTDVYLKEFPGKVFNSTWFDQKERKMTDKTEFTHADILRAFADGKKVERTFGTKNDYWLGCSFKDYTRWYDEVGMKFRIAPEPKQDKVYYDIIRPGRYLSIESVKRDLRVNRVTYPIVKITISGETGKLSVEIVENKS